jgi:hypothetical protein
MQADLLVLRFTLTIRVYPQIVRHNLLQHVEPFLFILLFLFKAFGWRFGNMVSVFVKLKSNLLVSNFFQNFIRGASTPVHVDLVLALQKLFVVV